MDEHTLTHMFLQGFCIRTSTEREIEKQCKPQEAPLMWQKKKKVIREPRETSVQENNGNEISQN